MRFPMFVELEGKRVVVAGAGKIGTRRIQILADFGAVVTVIAPKISDEVRFLWEEGRINCECRELKREDLGQAFLAVAATDSRKVNHQMAVWCKAAGIPVNTADKKEECDFYFPGIAREGNLIAGVCASGRNHRLAKEAAVKVRGLFAEEYGQKGDE